MRSVRAVFALRGLLCRAIFALVLCIGVSAACTGDCKSCHASLDYAKDKRHAPMLTCKSCHTDEKMAQIDMGGCGQDCFACHDAQKIQAPALAKEHAVIESCMSCHASLGASPFSNRFNTKGNVFDNSLKSFSDALLKE